MVCCLYLCVKGLGITHEIKHEIIWDYFEDLFFQPAIGGVWLKTSNGNGKSDTMKEQRLSGGY